MTPNKNIAILSAIAAAIIWSGNFIVARAVTNSIPPIGLAFFRWLGAAILIFPIAYPKLKQEWRLIWPNIGYLLFTAFAGITVFNTCIYVAGHYSPAINLALIGTTTSPVFSILLARIFFKERITRLRIAGLLLCISGILLLISKGSWETLLGFRFSTGDKWILLAAFAFAVYNTSVRKKPQGLSPFSFLFILFAIGTLLLTPFYIWEAGQHPAIQWDWHLIGIMAYLSAGASVISYLLWNKAIAGLGSARAALFGYLIPVFSSIEALILLHEQITWLHYACGVLVIGGLMLANADVLRRK